MQRKTIKKVTGTLHQGHYKSECQLLGLPLYALTSTPGKKVVVTTGAEKGEWIVETTNGEYTLNIARDRRVQKWQVKYVGIFSFCLLMSND
jgi:hypothetical protein